MLLYKTSYCVCILLAFYSIALSVYTLKPVDHFKQACQTEKIAKQDSCLCRVGNDRTISVPWDGTLRGIEWRRAIIVGHLVAEYELSKEYNAWYKCHLS